MDSYESVDGAMTQAEVLAVFAALRLGSEAARADYSYAPPPGPALNVKVVLSSSSDPFVTRDA